MKPSLIHNVLDLAFEMRKAGKTYNPCFAGDAGIGKSEICQQWAAKMREKYPDFWFYDLRLAYLEAPDLIGLTKIVEHQLASGVESRTTNILPDYWPDPDSDAPGMLLVEEPNRANSDILNAMMQLFTDRMVHKMKLAKNVIIVSCINPDNGNYDVTNMDTALKNRLEIFDVKYDKQDHLKFMEANKYEESLISFVKSGTWSFKPVEELGTEGVYVSPRTFSKVDSVLKSEVFDKASEDFKYDLLSASLGKHVATSFHKFTNDSKPLVAEDFKGRKYNKSIERLKQLCTPDSYRGDILSVTIESVAKAFPLTIDETKLFEIAQILPGDLAVNLLKEARGNHLSLAAKDKNIKQPLPVGEWLDLCPALRQALKTRQTSKSSDSGEAKTEEAEATKSEV
jgi:hypothetical protein